MCSSVITKPTPNRYHFRLIRWFIAHCIWIQIKLMVLRQSILSLLLLFQRRMLINSIASPCETCQYFPLLFKVSRQLLLSSRWKKKLAQFQRKVDPHIAHPYGFDLFPNVPPQSACRWFDRPIRNSNNNYLKWFSIPTPRLTMYVS